METCPPTDPAASPVTPSEASELRHKMDEHFASRTSMVEIDAMMRAYATGLAPARGMLNATASFLRLHPEACHAIAAQLLDPRTTRRSREMMMGLLGSAGSPAAQLGMRSTLDVPEVRSDVPSFARLILRLGLLAEPDRESLHYLLTLLVAPGIAENAELRRVTALALGSSSRRAGDADRGLADAIHARLVSGITSSSTASDTIGFIAAVGNAGRAGDVAMLLEVARGHAGDAAVREAVARALRGIDSPETRIALRELLADPNADVVCAAAEAYAARPLTKSDMTELATLVSGGGTVAIADSAMLGIVQEHMGHRDAATQILETILARHPDGVVVGRVLRLLCRLRGP